ncbi:hypothetical protein CYMTET_28495 [Cymbomonas tetramitiformis]|uniref:EF-hand domain-containing protein n=1 Tax=Cymbomonas tetramitiformis TaxID=36881 RepID=A0AAE0FN54_9CHLO|nr:hypothetical protein CYMTET_28495 [Cymbomonas tetramitiformis]|eukprot:gene19885-23790_t
MFGPARALCEPVELMPLSARAIAPSTVQDDLGGGAPPKEGDDDEVFVDWIIERFGKVAMKLGFGGCLGFCSGYAAKQLGKAAAVLIGVIFAFLQILAYNGFIEINWGKIKGSLEKKMDQDGDGKFNVKDIKVLLMGTFKVLKYNLPSATSFVPGFYYGFSCA